MLFLAVFCGSLAEYQLEHRIEKEREHQYIESMVADLHEDSAKINGSIKYCERQIRAFDTLLNVMYTTPYTDSSLRKMYIYEAWFANTRSFVSFTKRTIAQLNNSGGMRLIRNKAASDSIITYNEMTGWAETQSDYLTRVRSVRVAELGQQLFDQYYFRAQKDTSGGKKPPPFRLMSNDPRLIREYTNALYNFMGSLISYVKMLYGIKAHIPGMITFLEEKYDLEKSEPADSTAAKN